MSQNETGKILHSHLAYSFLCSSYRGRFIGTGLCPELRLYPQFVDQQRFSFITDFHKLSQVSRSIFQLWGVTSQAIPARSTPLPCSLCSRFCPSKAVARCGSLLGVYTPFAPKEKAQEWCMTTPTTKQWKNGPIFNWLFHNDAKHRSYLPPADIKSHLPLHFPKRFTAQSKAKSYFSH